MRERECDAATPTLEHLWGFHHKADASRGPMWIYTLVMQTNTRIHQTVLLSGLIEHNLSQSTSNSPTQSELKWDVVSLLSPLSHCCAHMYVRSLQTTKACKFVFLLQNNRCVLATVCVGFWSVFFALHACALPARDLRWKEPAGNLSPSLSFSPPGTFSSLYLPLLLLLVSHLSSHLAPLLSPLQLWSSLWSAVVSVTKSRFSAW